jgi:hypothetical protein
MGYRVLKDREVKWQSRAGLEGPFFYATGQVLYYDPKEGQYWDPTTDFYKTQEEMDYLNQELVRILSR